MNLPVVSEETFLIYLALAITAGILLGFALGYALKERRHATEIESITRIVRRMSEGKKERAPKGPLTGDGKVYRRPC